MTRPDNALARDYAALDDTVLVGLVRRGDHDAFRHIMRHSNQRLFRIVFVMREIEECTVEETASSLELRAETVKTRLHRARRLLRAALHDTLAATLTDAFPFLAPLRPHDRRGAEAAGAVVAATIARTRCRFQFIHPRSIHPDGSSTC